MATRLAKPVAPKNELKESDRRGGFGTVQTAEPREKVVSQVTPSPSTSASPTNRSESVETSVAAEDRHSQPASGVDNTASVPADSSSAAASLKEKRLANVKAIQDDLHKIDAEVALVRGEQRSKQYLRLEDRLTKALLRLDGIEADGDSEVRSARRAAVHAVQRTIDCLESTASAGEDATKMETDTVSSAEDDLAADENTDLSHTSRSETSVTEDQCVEAAAAAQSEDDQVEEEDITAVDSSDLTALAPAAEDNDDSSDRTDM